MLMAQKSMYIISRGIPAFMLLVTFCAAANAEPVKPDTSVATSVTLVSDYIWRGQSQTWGKPALQFSAEAVHSSGLYAGFFASNVSSQWVPGAHLETDWYTGVRNPLTGSLSGLAYDLNINYAYFSGGNFNKTGFNLPASSPDTVEISAAVNCRWLTVKTGRVLTKFYGWDTGNSSPGGFAGDPAAGVTGSTKGSYFMDANASYEISDGWSLNAQIGHQTIRNSHGLSWRYYKAGMSRTLDNWQVSLAGTASSEPAAYKNFVGLVNNGATYSAARPAVVFSVARNL